MISLSYLLKAQAKEAIIWPDDIDKMKETTLPETTSNSWLAPENWWLEDEFSFGLAYFQGLTASFDDTHSLES